MVGENLKFVCLKWSKMHFYLSTMIGENVESSAQITYNKLLVVQHGCRNTLFIVHYGCRNTLFIVHHGWRNFSNFSIEWYRYTFNCLPWLEKIF